MGRTHRPKPALRLLALAGLALAACGTASNEADREATGGGESAGYGLPNERRVLGGLVTGGQPDEAALRAAAAGGVRTVITLRQEHEPGFLEEQALARELGLRFVHIPIGGAADLTVDNARALDEALSEADPATTILHCGSGNRAGALLALRQFYFQGATREEALALGRAAGMTGLAPVVEEHLDGECETDPDPARCGAAEPAPSEEPGDDAPGDASPGGDGASEDAPSDE